MTNKNLKQSDIIATILAKEIWKIADGKTQAITNQTEKLQISREIARIGYKYLDKLYIEALKNEDLFFQPKN